MKNFCAIPSAMKEQVLAAMDEKSLIALKKLVDKQVLANKESFRERLHDLLASSGQTTEDLLAAIQDEVSKKTPLVSPEPNELQRKEQIVWDCSMPNNYKTPAEIVAVMEGLGIQSTSASVSAIRTRQRKTGMVNK
ncbi:hypothetical protein JCM19237_268 [Photobacterium aphoticum]|uniref:Uncharacterized protein n=1 Tax=Photobacterium aphoticum TaxID=754436 RepID=A0A090R035_9GAMM|nr:hypothetical protein JCM19237_268 [Photobacterium aphoticum]